MSGSTNRGDSGSTGNNSSTGTGEESDGAGKLHLPGPTLNDQYPQSKQVGTTGFGPFGGCIVLANMIDRPVRIESFDMKAPTNVRIVNEPCTSAATPDGNWGDDLTPPVTTCRHGTILEGVGHKPRHACSLNLTRTKGLDTEETATLVVNVTGTCSAASSQTCSWAATDSWTFAAQATDTDDGSPDPPVSSPETTPQTPSAGSPPSPASGT
ncbi:hypothetical protein [Streptomyces sp. NPDC096132]|uniref:hypothetical protein n=1 Tax=Streptomyces sp. NPDC096132 TaxID=3366075 RepID=UPI00382F41D8